MIEIEELILTGRTVDVSSIVAVKRRHTDEAWEEVDVPHIENPILIETADAYRLADGSTWSTIYGWNPAATVT